jgi:hypothetical protein
MALPIHLDRHYAVTHDLIEDAAKWCLGTKKFTSCKWEFEMFRCSRLCRRLVECASPVWQAFHSARSACTVLTRVARAAGTNDTKTADATTTAAAAINGSGPGS